MYPPATRTPQSRGLAYLGKKRWRPTAPVAHAVIGALAAWLAAAPPAARAADIVTIHWAADGRFVHRVATQASGIAEVCGEVGAGQAVRWRFEATAPLRFNIHHHEGKAVVYSERLESSAGSQGVLRPQRTDTYCWMWDRFPAAGAGFELLLERLAPPR
jgi:hypothetical protein